MKPEAATALVDALKLLESGPDRPEAMARLEQLAKEASGGKADAAATRALDEARRRLLEQGEAELAARLCELELGWERDVARRAALCVAEGRILLDELLDEEGAEACFRRALDEHADDEDAEEALSQLQLVRENWRKIVEKYATEAEAASDDTLRASLRVSMAELLWKRQTEEEHAGAIEEHLRAALAVDARNRRAATLLERFLRRHERWDEVAELLRAGAELPGLGREERLRRWGELMELQRDRLDRLDLARESARKMVAIDAAEPRALALLSALLTDEGDWLQLVRLYENALKTRRGHDDHTRQLLLALGGVQWEKLGNSEAAEPHFARVRKSEPTHPAVLGFYRAHYAERDEPAKLLLVLGQAQKAEQDARRRRELTIEMAQVAEEQARLPDKAIELWKGLLKSDADDAKAVAEAKAALRRLYAAGQKWNALLELLKEEAEHIEVPEQAGPAREAAIEARIALLLEVVELYRDRLNLDVMVVNTYNAILALAPDHAETLASLAAKYESMGRWNDLIGVLQRKADAIGAGEGLGDDDERAELLRRIAGLWLDKLNNLNQAVKPLEALHALVPTDGEATARLRDIYTRRRAWRQLVELELGELPRIVGVEERRRKLGEVAQLAAERLGDPREAIALWNRLLENSPDDEGALAALAALYEREKRWPALIEVLRRQQRQAGDEKQRVALLEKIGVLAAERLQSPALAASAYHEIIEAQPNHAKAQRRLRELLVQSGDFGALEEMYARNGQWEQLCDALLTVAERHDDPAVRLSLNLRVAAVAQEHLRQPERAIKAYEHIVELRGGLPAGEAATVKRAAEALATLYREGEKWPRLLAVEELLLEHAASDEERAAGYRRLSVLCEEKLGAKQRAFEWWAKAWRLAPANEAGEVEAGLIRLGHEAGAFAELSSLLGERLAKSSGAARVARLRELADLARTPLQRPDEARRHYEELLSIDPSDVVALDALEELHRQAGDSTALLAVCGRRLALLHDATERAELLFKIAWIEEEQAGDLEAAAATYERIVDECGNDPRALRALERIHEARGDHRRLASVVERQLDGAADDEAAAQLAHRLGELHELSLNDRRQALAWYEEAFARDPAHQPTIDALERYLAEGDPARVEVARLLAPAYVERHDVPRQVRTLQVLLDDASGDAEVPLLRELARLTGRRLGDAEAAWGYAVRLFERQPGDVETRRELTELAEAMDGHAEHVKKLAEAEQRVASSDPELARELAWEQGRIYAERLKREDEAERAWRRVLERDERHEGALAALEAAYRSSRRHAELRDLLERRAARADSDEARCGLLIQVAELDERALGDSDGAVASYRAVLDADPRWPQSQRAVQALERIYSKREAWRDLDELYARTVLHVEQATERAELLGKRGELHLHRLDDASHAVELYGQALVENPRHEGARAGLASLLDHDDVGLRHRAATILEPLYLDDESWEELHAALAAQRAATEGQEAVVLLSRIARLAEEQLDDPERALQAWRDAFRLAPDDEELHAHLERLAARLGRPRELAEAWEEGERLVGAHDLASRSAFLERAARIHDEVLADPARAKAIWRRLLELDPQNPATARPAAEALTRILHAEEDWPALIAVLRQRAAWSDSDGGARKSLLREVARIEEDRTQNYAAAIAAQRELLDEDPGDQGALDALERLHEVLEQWPELVEVLRRRVALVSDPAARRELLWRIAELTERRLSSPRGPWDEAIAAYAEVLDVQLDDRPTLEALARLHEAAERWLDLLDTLERRLLLSTETRERRALRGRIARLLEGPLAAPDEAIERYRAMLADDAEDETALAGLERLLTHDELRLTAAAVLEPIYQAHGEVEKLIALHELWAEHAPELRERIARLRRIVSLQETAGDGKAAFDAAARALRLAAAEPELPVLLDEAERLCADWPSADLTGELVALYQDIAADILDARAQERVQLEVAKASRRLGDQSTARDYFRRILDATPDHLEALTALEAIYREGDEHGSLLEVCTRRAELAEGRLDERRRYLMEAGRLCEEKLGRPDDAIVSYQQVLELFPHDAEAMEHLERLYDDGERHTELAELLERRLGYVDDLDEAVALRLRLGELHERSLGDGVGALESYHAVLSGDPRNATAIAAIERFLDDADLRTTAAEMLEPVYAGRQDWRSLARALELRLDDERDPPARLQLTRRLAHLHEEQLEDLDGAFAWFARLFRESPEDHEAREQFQRLANVIDAHARLAEIYETWLADVYSETPASLEVLVTLAALYDGRLADLDRAKACYLRLLAHDPADDQAFQRLEDALTRGRRWEELAQVYRDAADATPDVHRCKALLLKMCHLRRHALRDLDGAIELYREMVELDGEDRDAWLALDQLYTEGERWHDLAEHLTQRLDGVDDVERAALKLRLGHLRHERLDDPEGAVDLFEEVIGRDPEDRDAVAALEGLLTAPDAQASGVEVRVAELLEPVYRASDEWQKLIELLALLLERVSDAPRRVAMLDELARLHAERGGDHRRSFAALGRAWSEQIAEGPDGEEQLYERLMELALRLDAWRELKAVLEQGAAKVYDEELEAQIWARIATIEDQRLREPQAAVASWRKVAALRPDDARAWKAIERLLVPQDRPAELVDVLEKRAALTDDIGEQKALRYRIADLHERALGQRDEAVRAWREVLDLDDGDRPALLALERLHRELGQHLELANVIERQIELASVEEERRPLRGSLAQVHEQQGDAHAAISVWREVFDEHPGDEEAAAALLRLYERESMWPDLVETLDRIAELHEPGPEQDTLRLRAARVIAAEERDAFAAIERYRQILDEAMSAAAAGSARDQARAALEELLAEEETREAAAEVLESYYRRCADWAALVKVLEVRFRDAQDLDERRALVADMAELQETALDDPAAAFASWTRLLADEPGEPQLHEQLGRLAARTDGWRELARLYAEQFESIYEPEARRALALELGRLAEERFHDPSEAIAWHRRALDLPGEELPVLVALERLLSRDMAANARDLAEVLEREAEHVEEPEAQAALWSRLGTLRKRQLDDTEDALGAWRLALERDPAHQGARAALEDLAFDTEHGPAALDVLEALYDADEDHPRRIYALEARLGHLDSATERAELLSRVAAIAEHDLHDPAQALEATARALLETPEEPQLADEVERLGDVASQPMTAVAAFERALAQGAAGDAAIDLGLRAARLHERLRDETSAEARYLAVLELDGEHAEALTALERIHRAAGHHAALAEVLTRRAAVELDPMEQRTLLAEAAHLHGDALGDEEGAAQLWRRVLELDDTDDEAQAELARLHEAAGRYHELVEVLEQQARYADSPERQAELHARIAEVSTEHLDDLDRAARAWRDALDAQPDSLRALTELEALHLRREDYAAAKDVLMQQLTVVPTEAERVPIFHRLARLSLDHQHDADEAIGYLQAVLDIAPDDGAAFSALEQVLVSLERWFDLVDLLERHAELADEAGEHRRAVSFLLRAADVLVERLDSADRAADVLERVSEREPDNLRVLAALAKIYDAMEDRERCRDTLQRAAALGGSGPEVAEIQFRLGHLEDELSEEQADAGERYYLRALEFDPRHVGALEAFERIARRKGDWDGVAMLLHRRAEASAPEARRSLWRELATLQREHLARPDEAVRSLQRALDAGPASDDAIELRAELAESLEAAGHADEALPLYLALVDDTLAASKGRRTRELARLHFRIGALFERRGDDTRALEQYEAAQSIDAAHVPTLAALGRLSMRAAEWEKARRVYRSLLLQNLDADSGLDKAEVYLALGEIHERLDELPKAASMYERGLEQEPDDGRLREALARVRAAR